MTTIEPIYLPDDCWSMALSFLPTYSRTLVGPTNKQIYGSLRNSFTGQKVMHLRSNKLSPIMNLALYASAEEIDLYRCECITDVGLEHLKNVNVINLNTCRSITDAGLAHLKNVKKINLCETNITDAGLAYLRNVKVIDLTRTKVHHGLKHLENAEKINLDGCRYVTDNLLTHLKNVKEINLNNCVAIHTGKELLQARGVNVC